MKLISAQAYFSLGNYPSTSYCFPDPERCPEGTTVAFWLKVVGGAGPSQGLITTQPGGGPGFQVYFNNVNLIFAVRRDSDSIVEVVTDYVNDFVSTYGFGTWVHCIMTHKMVNTGNNMHVYINGESRLTEEKWTQGWPVANTQDYDGNLQLGTMDLGDNWWGTANIQVDDLIIWEEQIPCDDALRLYLAYNG